MPPKKRGRPPGVSSGAPQRPGKKVRVGETSIIGTQAAAEVTESGRPKRTAAGEPDYSQKINKSRTTNRSNNNTAAAPKASPKAPAANQSIVTRKKKPASQLFGKRRPCMTAPAISQSNAPAAVGRGRGRPKKVRPAGSITVNDEAAPIPKKGDEGPKRARGRPKKIVKPGKFTEAATSDKEAEVDDVPNGALDSKYEEDEAAASKAESQYWLLKAEPESRVENGVDVKFSIDDLKAKAGSEAWDGVRNPSARNSMRAMQLGDLAFFYHSNCKVPGIVGVMRIVEEHTVDDTAFDPSHPYYDAKSSRDKPKWDIVRVEFVRKFPQIVKLSDLRSFAESGGALESMQMLKQSRLSVSAVKPSEWEFIMGLAGDDDDIEEASEGGQAKGAQDESEIQKEEVDDVHGNNEATDTPKLEILKDGHNNVSDMADQLLHGQGENIDGTLRGGGGDGDVHEEIISKATTSHVTTNGETSTHGQASTQQRTSHNDNSGSTNSQKVAVAITSTEHAGQ